VKDLNSILKENGTSAEEYEIARRGFTMAEFEAQQARLREIETAKALKSLLEDDTADMMD